VTYTAGGGTRPDQGPGSRPLRCRPSKARAALRPPLKRALDVVGATLLLLLVAPAFALVWLLVRANGGPAFVARRRVGRGGREFGHLAFRIPEADTGDGRGAACGRRPTRLGRALRRTALDEVPQLLNVLRGDMGLVGPRPVSREDLDRSYALFGGAAAYLSVRPGLIGPCQVCGRGDLGARERVALDAAYARAPSLRADLAILARALAMVLPRPGAR
jgi:exopolysaccharide production protein ExoY